MDQQGVRLRPLCTSPGLPAEPSTRLQPFFSLNAETAPGDFSTVLPLVPLLKTYLGVRDHAQARMAHPRRSPSFVRGTPKASHPPARDRKALIVEQEGVSAEHRVNMPLNNIIHHGYLKCLMHDMLFVKMAPLCQQPSG